MKDSSQRHIIEKDHECLELCKLPSTDMDH